VDDYPVQEPPLRTDAEAARWNHRDDNDGYSQAGDLLRLMKPAKQQNLVNSIVVAVQGIPQDIQARQIGHFLRADPAYGRGVARGLDRHPRFRKRSLSQEDGPQGCGLQDKMMNTAGPKLSNPLRDRYTFHMAHLAFTQNLARHTECPDVDIPAATVAQLLEAYFSRWSGVRGYVLDDQGAVRKHIMVIVDGRALHDRHTLSDTLAPESEVFVLQALSGG
jgi:molybdopterin synthase sulfur carrier subunit